MPDIEDAREEEEEERGRSESSRDGQQEGLSEITPQERINELNEIDLDVSKMLRSVSAALGVLSGTKYDSTNPTLESAEDKFKENVDSYYETLASIAVRLRRQAYALEEAGLIEEGNRLDAQRATSMIEDMSRRSDGSGMLEPSWLNARAKDTTGKAIRAETIAELKEFLKKSNINIQHANGDGMDVDPDS